jgi:hypothetical protein
VDASHHINVNSSGGVTDTSHLTGWFAHPPGWLTAVVYLSIGVIWLSFVGHQVLSWRRASGEQRQQLKWHAVLRLHTPVAVAASTLAAAALFSPLRRRVQRAVDRRLNRARYDADQAVAAFAARLKVAVSLDSAQDDPASVVTKVLEPAHVSVWSSKRK